MANKLVLLVLLVAVVYCISASPVNTKCGPNQVFDACKTACEPSCKNPNPRSCVLKCVIGCRCLRGYVEDDNGNCVLLRNCH
ncbi:hypothetical protein KPH14_007287 [Odynerus spinipes]|uniref:TIL domain-containing protein n=1 Tax=Odynerus spinipes TaxID=1348599 RepID=A0AAD9RA27_9HYME|nr:hypothetical protein KPH14_007287 [Odynerus spinipes]